MQNNHSSQSSAIIHERLRQARLSFNLALRMSAASAVISLVGAALLMSGKLATGTATATGGAVSIAYCLSLAKSSNDRLDQMAAELGNED